MSNLPHLTPLAALALVAISACTEVETTAQESEQTSELASCRIIAADPEQPMPRAIRAGATRTACDELNDHLASIAHISAVIEAEELEEGGAR